MAEKKCYKLKWRQKFMEKKYFCQSTPKSWQGKWKKNPRESSTWKMSNTVVSVGII